MTENRLTNDLPGFDGPLALLRACHEKIFAHCDLLEGMVAYMVEAGPRVIGRMNSTSGALTYSGLHESR